MIRQEPNLLLLDEPTNHLDLEMRQALSVALIEYAGALVVISHDRHLLRSVCDDLWLVDSGVLQRFEQDLDHYPTWLARRKSRPESATIGVADNQQLTRRQLKSQLNQLNTLEKDIASLSAVREKLEQQLSDNSIYDADNRERLNASLAAQVENRKLLTAAEENWLLLSEAIEQQGN
jgi:ATP-binding cassette subfamily F protein 3